MGRLVHRALQLECDDPERLADVGLRAADGNDELVESARVALASLRANPEVTQILMDEKAIWRSYEMPFTYRTHDGTVIRGTIDCVVRRPDGSIHVFEFKTGRADVTHGRQLDIYVEAARAMFAGALVEGHLVYASDHEATFQDARRLT
jgi:ATP-dependent exoDNAse (exonuclease V) beta subunit